VLEAIDLTNKNDYNPHDNSHMSTKKIKATLDSITSYNHALPKARKKKDSLPEIRSHGISIREVIRRDPKKKDLYLHKNYAEMGMAEGYVGDKTSN
jgi:hypothetical protein